MNRDNVTAIRGGPIYQRSRPNPHVITMLEDLLERARAGNVIGLVAVDVDEAGLACWHKAGKTGGFSLLGGVAALQSYLSDAANGEDDL